MFDLIFLIDDIIVNEWKRDLILIKINQNF